MKLDAKSFISGVAITAIVMSTPLAFAATQKSINAIFGQVKLVVNGKNVDKETLLYDGRTYLPLRDTADALGMEVGWDEKTSTAYIDPIGTNRRFEASEEPTALDWPANVPLAKADVYPSGDVMFEKPKAGDKVVVMKTNYGDIKLKFFPKYAPKTVENFLGLAEKGYYDGVTFHRVINDFMIQGGDPTATGMGGESLWGEPFQDEFAFELANVRGALCMANSGENTNGSQFYIVQNNKLDEGYKQQYDYYSKNPDYVLGQMEDGSDVTVKMMFPERIINYYLKNGGTPFLDFTSKYYFGGQSAHAVFGMVYEGMDVVDKIAAIETDGNDKPIKDVVMESVKVVTIQ